MVLPIGPNDLTSLNNYSMVYSILIENLFSNELIIVCFSITAPNLKQYS